MYIDLYFGAKDGVYLRRYDTDSQRIVFSMSGVSLAFSPDGCLLFAAEETKNADGIWGQGGIVHSFFIHPQYGVLTHISQRESLGAIPCAITSDRTGGFVLVANRGTDDLVVLGLKTQHGFSTLCEHDDSTTVLFPVLGDGTLANAVSVAWQRAYSSAGCSALLSCDTGRRRRSALHL